jgi:ferredoxin
MPTIEYEGEKIECEEGANLRGAILGAGEEAHNGPRALSCQGNGICGTCAVEIEDGDAGEPSAQERLRLGAPPHNFAVGLRLACQVEVTEDLEISKRDGLYGTL